MRALLDSCSIINLVNVDALALACSLDNIDWWVPPVVIAEIDARCEAAIANTLPNGRLGLIDDADVDADLYLRILDEHRLGAGETECIAIALAGDHSICLDDRRARRVAETLLGPDRTFGTVRLLRWCVEQERIACGDAKTLLRGMRDRGGFLPDTPQSFFCRGN